MKFAFISRHTPTQDQVLMAQDKGIELVHVGDRDAFTVNPQEFQDFEGVVVVHPAMAMRLCKLFKIGVFENGNRAAEGEKPQFYPKELHIYT